MVSLGEWCEWRWRCCRVTVAFPPSLPAMITFRWPRRRWGRCQLASHSPLPPDSPHLATCQLTMHRIILVVHGWSQIWCCFRGRRFLKTILSYFVIDCKQTAAAIYLVTASGARGSNEGAMIAGNLWLKGETIPSLDIGTLDSLDFSQMKTFERCIFVSGAKASDITRPKWNRLEWWL